MSNRVKRLQVNRETVRELDSARMVEAAGGSGHTIALTDWRQSVCLVVWTVISSATTID
ncbi:MAG TPA: hypothetical protein VG245_09310 [Candidatus Dormibacteraeota bacterium]|jgi:hypothetical protein|nr:hypothetical protein [Candidatus Dormibacteraeota bacterium]